MGETIPSGSAVRRVERGGAISWARTHVGSRAAARRLAKEMLDTRLAACANMWSIASTYWWKGSLVETDETVVLFKTSPASLARLVEAIGRVHPYELPYVAWGRGETVTRAYASWVKDQTRGHRPPRRAGARRGARRKT